MISGSKEQLQQEWEYTLLKPDCNSWGISKMQSGPVHNSILVTDYLTKMGIKTVPQPPYSPDVAPCDFCLFPKHKENLRGCRYETIEEMKEAVQRSLIRSHKRTSMGPRRSCWNGTTSALQLEEITSKGTRVSCTYSQ